MGLPQDFYLIKSPSLSSGFAEVIEWLCGGMSDSTEGKCAWCKTSTEEAEMRGDRQIPGD